MCHHPPRRVSFSSASTGFLRTHARVSMQNLPVVLNTVIPNATVTSGTLTNCGALAQGLWKHLAFGAVANSALFLNPLVI